MPRRTQVLLRSLSVSDTGLSPSTVRLSSQLLLPNHESYVGVLQPQVLINAANNIWWTPPTIPLARGNDSPLRGLGQSPNLMLVELMSTWFGLVPVRSPLLRESRLISSPAGTEMFHFPALASMDL